MSKIGRSNLQLQEQAEELGFSTTQEALDNGYHVVEDLVTGNRYLKILDDDAGKYSPGVWTSASVNMDEQDKAHEAWLKDKEEVLGGLVNLMVHSVYDYDTVIKAYNFIKEQCHD